MSHIEVTFLGSSFLYKVLPSNFIEILLPERQSKKIHRTLPTSMESSTATNSSFPAKLLLVIQVQCCFTIEDFAVQAGMVAVETYIDVGNILWIFYDCLKAGHIHK